MRKYYSPLIYTEAFMVEDIITESSNHGGGLDSGDEILGKAPDLYSLMSPDVSVESGSAPSAPSKGAPKLEVFGSVDAEGSFSQEITGGNVVQEGLNNLYENFLSKF